jgi:hypothetical protein
MPGRELSLELAFAGYLDAQADCRIVLEALGVEDGAVIGFATLERRAEGGELLESTRTLTRKNMSRLQRTIVSSRSLPRHERYPLLVRTPCP